MSLQGGFVDSVADPPSVGAELGVAGDAEDMEVVVHGDGAWADVEET